MASDPVDPEFHAFMSGLRESLTKLMEENFERPIAFCLIMTEFDEHNPADKPERANYISNVQRPDSIKLLSTLLEQWKADERNTN
jgi:hypothetical protein